uniref:Matrin-3-like n=1 Tax=Lepisosteus oculatus TaxID=7918 RepID=W5N0S8_LEPOC|nr:PREDICTED: matrin-3-like [Lepisosteus oculatus]XP_015205384.1 PREDICTED: matrin-3-like [Lepisosteus oculatus]XP_015205385.1 PREDICTED: matrin-3-like [Lepisosteus oculatus]
MSQKTPSNSVHKGFTAGRGLLAAAESLNFSMSDQRSHDFYPPSSRPSNSMTSPLRAEGRGQDSYPSLRTGNVDNAMKLFASLGLSPKDLDILAQIPEDNISVETLPRLIMQLKARKGEGSRRMNDPRDLPPLLPDPPYRASRDDWNDVRHARPASSVGESSGRSQAVDFSYGHAQEGQSRSFERIGYSEGGSRDRRYSELSQNRYGSDNQQMGTSLGSESLFMQRRTGSPSPGKVQDFHGVMPRLFPHVCSLCDFDVHSSMEWTQHINGLRHAECRRLLLQVYPDWDPQSLANRVPDALLLETTNRAEGILGPAPLVPGLQRGGLTSTWTPGNLLSGQGDAAFPSKPKIRTKVVVAKFDRGVVTLSGLKSLIQPFGTLCQHLVLQNKAFLEMLTHEEAAAVVNFYQQKPAVIHGKKITLYLSPEIYTINKRRSGESRESQVVYFCNLPKVKEKKTELLAAANRFGVVEKYLFLNEQAFVQMKDPEDAKMMVKYYTLHPLHIRGRTIRLNICTKYKTLTVNPSKSTSGKLERSSSSSIGSKDLCKKPQSTTKEKTSRDKAASAGKKKEEHEAKPEENSGDEGSGVMAREGGAEGIEVEEGMEEDSEELAQALEMSESQEEEQESDTLVQEEPNKEPTAEFEIKPEEPEATPLDVSETTEPAENEEPQEPAEMNALPEKPTEGLEVPAEVVPEEMGESAEVPTEERDNEEEGFLEQDFPENMEDFVTLDEFADEDSADLSQLVSETEMDTSRDSKRESQEGKVVNVRGFKRGYNFLTDILKLAKPFGKVVQHLVLDTRHEAFLEMATPEEAKAMVEFYNTNVTAMVCGKPVNIHLSHTYKTIQFQEKTSGRVIYIGQIPWFRFTDASLLKLAQPFGTVKRYLINRNRKECFIEMAEPEQAEKMAQAYKDNPPKFGGKWLTVYVSKKYKTLRGRKPSPSDAEEERKPKRERTESTKSEEDAPGSSESKAKATEEGPPVKKLCTREERGSPEKPDGKELLEESATKSEQGDAADVKSSDSEEKNSESPDTAECQKSAEEEPSSDDAGGAASSNGETTQVCDKEETPQTKPRPESKPELTPVPLGPYQPNNPVGVEYVKMGYYCRVCFLFYSNEETAKKVHCSSLSHYQKLKKHLDKERANNSQ